MRNLVIKRAHRQERARSADDAADDDAKAPGGVEAAAPVLVVEHQRTDNNLMKFRFKKRTSKMQAAEEDSRSARQVRAGAFIIPSADRGKLEPILKDLGLSAWAVALLRPSARTISTCANRLRAQLVPHQDEGGCAPRSRPMACRILLRDIKLREGNLRAIVRRPSSFRTWRQAQSQVNGSRRRDVGPLPYKKSCGVSGARRERFGRRHPRRTGVEGLVELVKFVQAGGTLVTEGSTSRSLPEYNVTTGVTGRESRGPVRARIDRARCVCRQEEPLAYGFDGTQIPCTSSGSGPERGCGGGFGGGFGRRSWRGFGRPPTPRFRVGMIVTPMGGRRSSSGCRYDPEGRHGRCDLGQRPGGVKSGPCSKGWPAADAVVRRRWWTRRLRWAGGAGSSPDAPRVVLAVSGGVRRYVVVGHARGGSGAGESAQLVDIPLGQGHVVSFAIRPVWRWQTQEPTSWRSTPSSTGTIWTRAAGGTARDEGRRRQIPAIGLPSQVRCIWLCKQSILRYTTDPYLDGSFSSSRSRSSSRAGPVRHYRRRDGCERRMATSSASIRGKLFIRFTRLRAISNRVSRRV